MPSGNPTLSTTTFSGLGRVAADRAMTIQGTVNKSLLLLVLVFLSAAHNWNAYYRTMDPSAVMPLMMVGVIGGLIAGFITIFKKTWAAVTAPIYALLEGLVIGGVSALAEAQFQGIVIQAVGLTFGTCFALLLAYKSGMIRATEKFKMGVVAATGGIALVYVASIILGFFGVRIPLIYESGIVGIGFSIVVVIIAAMNLVLDFDMIETGAAQGAPRYMEWYCAFGLMVTLIWLYLEILRLLTKLRSRD